MCIEMSGSQNRRYMEEKSSATKTIESGVTKDHTRTDRHGTQYALKRASSMAWELALGFHDFH
jgi:hypothetical protein